MKEITILLANDVLWAIYNLAFITLGKTKAWPWLGQAIWR